MIGKNGIVYSQSHKEALDEISYNISFKITKDMAPEADVIAFYTRDQDGEIIHDQFRLQLPLESHNTVS